MLSNVGLLVLSTLASGFTGWFVFDTLKKDFAARMGQLQSHLNALQGRLKDAEEIIKKHKAEMAEVSRMAGSDISKLERQLNEGLDSKVDAQAIDNMNDEFFSLKSAVEELGQKNKKKARKKSRRK